MTIRCAGHDHFQGGYSDERRAQLELVAAFNRELAEAPIFSSLAEGLRAAGPAVAATAALPPVSRDHDPAPSGLGRVAADLVDGEMAWSSPIWADR